MFNLTATLGSKCSIMAIAVLVCPLVFLYAYLLNLYPSSTHSSTRDFELNTPRGALLISSACTPTWLWHIVLGAVPVNFADERRAHVCHSDGDILDRAQIQGARQYTYLSFEHQIIAQILQCPPRYFGNLKRLNCSCCLSRLRLGSAMTT